MNKPIKPKMGRPVGSTIDNPKVVLPSVMVDPNKLAAYKQTAKASGNNFSQWVRAGLNNYSNKSLEEEFEPSDFVKHIKLIADDMMRLNWLTSSLQNYRQKDKIEKDLEQLEKLPNSLKSCLDALLSGTETAIIVVLARLFDRDLKTASLVALSRNIQGNEKEIYEAYPEIQQNFTKGRHQEELANFIDLVTSAKNNAHIKAIVYKARGQYVAHRVRKFEVNKLPTWGKIYTQISETQELVVKMLNVLPIADMDSTELTETIDWHHKTANTGREQLVEISSRADPDGSYGRLENLKSDL